MKALSLTDRALLRRVPSRATIEDLFDTRIRRNLRAGRWIRTGNRYRTATVERLAADKNAGGTRNADLSEYIAASSPVHATDGWALLGRALQCLLRGDADNARHLAYYAELRAGMSFLAAEGIGVFRDTHYLVSKTSCQPTSKTPTHTFIWPCLKQWAERADTARVVGDRIRMSGISLNSWLSASGLGSLRTALGQRWLKLWALDLKVVRDDRDARNIASYRPSHFNQADELSATEAWEFTRDLWAVLQPSGAGVPETLDRCLVRRAMEEGFKGVTGRAAATDPVGFATHVDRGITASGLEAAAAGAVRQFLLRAILPADPTLLIYAQQKGALTSAKHHLQVLSRATLLLHLASSAVVELLRRAGSSKAALGFWWQPLGLQRGLWDQGAEPAAAYDLWADVEEAVNELERWRTDPGTHTTVTLQSIGAPLIHRLSACELVALWRFAA